jgi:hypothetical protein
MRRLGSSTNVTVYINTLLIVKFLLTPSTFTGIIDILLVGRGPLSDHPALVTTRPVQGAAVRFAQDAALGAAHSLA